MKPLSLTINGCGVQAQVEPRLNLADFLREHQALTATHVGCEHGVCGACTVWIDGAPARSCITFAAAANGAEITTLEGFEKDPVMGLLREAFADNHGLQCGFCTPGMLMTARDIITRLPDADEKRIRLELSGNLCRCTGYVGIVKAIQSAQAAAKAAGYAKPAANGRIGPVGSHAPTTRQDFSQRPASNTAAKPAALSLTENFDVIDWAAVEQQGVELRQSFAVPFGRDQVWRFFADLDQVTRCMPGARLTRPMQGSRAEGEVNVKLGPIVSAFHGVLDVSRDDSQFRGTVRGAGRDAKSPSSARAIITYAVQSSGASASQVEVAVRFLLSGVLAQFSRSGLVKDVADHLTRVFTQNLEARMSGRPAAAETAETLDAAAIARSALWTRITGFVRRFWSG
ncbi:xanthine dehydrogenase family Fe-S subunit [Rhodoplanes sp. Z2-YC6860]|uniref:xanthine dehydrogenase family Fe-S subunit n=1 Tax=Rhodoplanes sp. Z2-YC6860 TaxID=674703 RepID=UPI00078C7D51|nr:2Fe-2S iron-sulfur cluster-binding protein [Rhodoplanes sp. Z2-YC6860]AMN41107.1 Aerobic-type carbon monoxide dehydrogenase, small subunit CoxS/CutS-like protein [Rhodoplanes sp. Z2-YC6860]